MPAHDAAAVGNAGPEQQRGGVDRASTDHNDVGGQFNVGGRLRRATHDDFVHNAAGRIGV